uniref:Nuclear factor interleukin-3-regulated protein n=1 Tax=Cacopsylla melanoneura TaxID=428564 RepID=A0A8D9C031_9HEMI
MVAEFINEKNKLLHHRIPLGNMPESHKINAINHGSSNGQSHSSQFCSNENSMAGPISPTGSTESVSYMDNYLPGFDLAGHLQRKEIFSQRKQREFIPDNKKDESYWDRRKRNNEAAKRSREKRRFNDMILEQRVVELSNENHILKAQLAAIKDKFGINGESMVNVEQVMATLPSNDQGLTIPKRSKLSPGAPPSLYSPNVSPIPPPVLYSTNSSHEIYSQNNNHHPDNELPPYNNSSENYNAFPFSPVLPPINPPVFESSSNIVLNLSRNRGKVKSRHKSVSSNSPRDSDNEESVHVPLIFSVNSNTSSNNSGLPHKLRHKIHLNEKDIPTSTSVPVQNIKQEPEPRATPPWDTEGSSDERDSGISLGQDWGVIRQNVTHQPASPPSSTAPIETPHDSRLQSEVARLVSEVENLKNYLTQKPSPSAPPPPTKSNIPVK